MMCPNCRARGFEVEMVYENTSYEEVLSGGPMVATIHRPRARYSCPHDDSEFVWTPGRLVDLNPDV